MEIITKLDYNQVPAFNEKDIQYQTNPDFFSSFLSFLPNQDGLLEAISQRSDFPIDRSALVNEIMRQYKDIKLDPLQISNIQALLSEHSYTVITAHQPSLLLGPLYYVYKIISCINLAETLSKISGKKIIPVFILGSEDHDFEEVNSVNLFNKKITWETEQKGPVGRFHKQGLDEVIEQVKLVLGDNDHAKQLSEMFDLSNIEGQQYNDFMIRLLNLLFGKYGLIVANMDTIAFKSVFKEKIKEEIFTQKSKNYVTATQESLQKIGITAQAHVRDINIFYMLDGLRERIVFENDKYLVLNTDLSFTKEELENEIEINPQKFSPNVIMRPLYQESVWPNIAYIGGGGELAYWMERKSQFTAFNTYFPALIRRNSALVLKKNQRDNLQKLNINIDQIFNNEDNIINVYLSSIANDDINTKKEEEEIEKVFKTLKAKAVEADKSLESFIEAEEVKAKKQIEQIESRIKRAFKKNEETAVNQIKNIRAKLFPSNGLQERSDSFMNFYLTQGPQFIDDLKKFLDPLDKQFIILCE